MKIVALMDYKDIVLKKDVKQGEDIVVLYKKAKKELTDERIEYLLNGNESSGNQPIVEKVEDEKHPIIDNNNEDEKDK